MATYSIYNGYKKRRTFKRFGTLTVSIFIISAVTLTLFRPKTDSTESSATAALSTQPKEVAPPLKRMDAQLPWPHQGQGAYGVPSNGVLAESDSNNQQVPIASLAKVITALALVKNKPLDPGQQGPVITLTQNDVELYGEYLNKNGSVAPVEVGEKITQHQAMQAMLMTSANNMSDSLVIWAFGSVEEYSRYANGMLKEMGLSNTHVADASGFSPNTKSTLQDMTRLGYIYMQNPVLKSIAMQDVATIPVAGTFGNYNALVNGEGIVGIKVGDTDEAGRCFMAADLRDGDPKNISIAVVLGAQELGTAMKEARNILKAGNSTYDELKSAGTL